MVHIDRLSAEGWVGDNGPKDNKFFAAPALRWKFLSNRTKIVLNETFFAPDAGAAMLRMGKLTDYATVVLASLAQEPDRHRAATELADRTRLGRATVSKVLKELQRGGMVISSRGSMGGYRLARRPELITAAQILDVFEGPIAITECSATASHCGIEKLCRVSGAWQRINAAIRRALEDVTLHQLAGLDSVGHRVGGLAMEIRLDADQT
jgi:FeS assembly SUF system regulator